MKKLIKIPEWLAVDRLKRYIDDCDGDELAWLLGDIFGGTCEQNMKTGNYDFEPNEYYAGEFNGLNKKKGRK